MAGNLRSQSCYILQVGILSRVLEEVDKIIQQFKDMLYKKMEDPHVEISQV
jgi:exocyst complex component 2